MGVFKVEVKLSNWQNQSLPEDERAEDVVCDALVDTGALYLCLPAEIVESLRLIEVGRRRLRIADNSVNNYRMVGMVDVEVQGRNCQVRAVELPHGATPLLGAIPLEDMDWHVSPAERRLVPNPLSADGEPIGFI